LQKTYIFSITRIATLLLVLFSFSVSAQSAKDFYNRGVDKANAGDIKGAVSAFDEAIRLDPQNAIYYYNRGTAKFYLNDFKSAIADLDNAASIEPNDSRIYSNRGAARLSMDDPKGAIFDFDKAIKLDANSARDYFMRGQAKIGLTDKTGGCDDLHKAKELGHKHAQEYIDQYCNDSIADLRLSKKSEYLRLDWPDAEGWKMASNNVAGEMQTVELLRNNENFENWTEIGTMIVYSSPGPLPPIEEAMKFMVDQAKSSCPNAVATQIEKDEKAEYPWIIFKIECNAEMPESQVWQIIEGKQDMFINFRAVKQKKVPEDLKTKWVKFFKTAKIQKS